MLQTIEGGGWGGRPYEDGESASVSVCQGDVRNGTLETIELKTPVLIEERVAAPGFGRRRQVPRRARHRLQVRNLVEGRWNLGGKSRADPRRPGASSGGKPGDTACYLLRTPGENDFAEKNAYRHPVPAGQPR